MDADEAVRGKAPMTAKARANSNCLKDALAAFRAAAGDDLDPKAAAVLDQLAVDDRAAGAFAKLDLNEADAAGILTGLSLLGQLANNFQVFCAENANQYKGR